MQYKSKRLSIHAISEGIVHLEHGSLTHDGSQIIKKILKSLSWKPSELSLFIVVTQTPDVYLPSTAFCIQKELGISKQAMVYDINAGADGLIKAMIIANSMLNHTENKKSVILCGDLYHERNIISAIAFDHGKDDLYQAKSITSSQRFHDIFQKIEEEQINDHIDIKKLEEIGRAHV